MNRGHGCIGCMAKTKTYQDIISGLESNPGISRALARQSGSDDGLIPVAHGFDTLMLAALDLLDSAPEKDARIVLGASTIHCRSADGWSIAVMAPTGHPVGKSIARTIRRVLTQLAKADAESRKVDA
jgi:hypothetical protein